MKKDGVGLNCFDLLKTIAVDLDIVGFVWKIKDENGVINHLFINKEDLDVVLNNLEVKE